MTDSRFRTILAACFSSLTTPLGLDIAFVVMFIGLLLACAFS